jgi:hypothetical protein
MVRISMADPDSNAGEFLKLSQVSSEPETPPSTTPKTWSFWMDSDKAIKAKTDDGVIYTFGRLGLDASNSLIVRATGVSLNVGTKQTLYTVPSAYAYCYPTVFLLKNANANLTTAEFSFGFNANADDVKAAATYTELTGSGIYSLIAAKQGSARGAASSVLGIKCTVTQAATIDIDVFGMLQM